MKWVTESWNGGAAASWGAERAEPRAPVGASASLRPLPPLSSASPSSRLPGLAVLIGLALLLALLGSPFGAAAQESRPRSTAPPSDSTSQQPHHQDSHELPLTLEHENAPRRPRGAFFRADTKSTKNTKTGIDRGRGLNDPTTQRPNDPTTQRPSDPTTQPPKAPRLLILVLDRVTLPDVMEADAPTLQRLLRQGAVGLMNTTSSEGRTAPGSYVTLSSGIVALPPEEYGQCYGGREPFEGGRAVDVYLRRTGRRASPEAIVHLGVAPLHRVNRERLTGATPGALGNLLSRLGPTAAIGNSDGGPQDPPSRFAPSLLIRSSGLIDRGDVSRGLLQRDPEAPFGLSLSPPRLAEAYQRVAGRSAAVLVDLGETARSELYRPYLPKTAVRPHRLQALRRADRLARAVLARVNARRTEVVLLCPFPALSEEGRVMNLGFVALPGAPRGILTSGTTRTPGLVANVDLLPTLARRLRLPLPSGPRAPILTGAPMTVVPSRDPVADLARMDSMVSVNRGIATGGELVFTVALIGFLGALATVLWWARGSGPAPVPILAVRAALLLGVVAPLALAVVPAFSPDSVAGYLTAFVPTCVALVLVLLLLPPGLSLPLGLLALSLFMAIDLLRGGYLLAFSVLSDFAIVGTRFHGLANEYMGVFVGASLMGGLLLLERGAGWGQMAVSAGPEATDRGAATRAGGPRGVSLRGLWLLALWYAACVLVVAWPTLGDNAGGVSAAVFAYGVALLLLSGRRLSGRAVAGLGLVSFVLLALVSLIDGLGDSPTHLGHTARLVARVGPSYLASVAARKLAMNWQLATDPRALWTYAAAALLALLWLRLRPARAAALLKRRPMLGVGGRAALAGAIAAFLSNDTGVLPAVLILAALAVTLAFALQQDLAGRSAESEGPQPSH